MSLADNVLTAYRNADRELKGHGLRWYPTAAEVAREVANMAGIPFLNGAAVIAVLSPQTSWDHNVKWAFAIADAYRNGDPLPSMGLGNNLRRAEIALTSLDDVKREKGTLKVRNFWGSITGETGAVCIDRHAIRIAEADPNADINSISDGKYRKYARAYLDAARVLHRRAADVQAATWCDFRGVAY